MTTMVRKLRLQRGWTQEQLAELSGLSVRSIQRIERGQACSLETQNALAAVFQVDRSVLDRHEKPIESTPADNGSLRADELSALRELKGLRDFLSHVFLYCLVVVAGGIVFGFEHSWMLWGAIGWATGIVGHGLAACEVLSILDFEWEKKEFEKRTGRSLRVISAERGADRSLFAKVQETAMKLSAGLSSAAALAGVGLLAWVSYDAGSVTNTLGLRPMDEAAVALVTLSLGAFLVVFGMYSWRKARKAAPAQVV
jgi:transcriptional regulator with XRE-family HTH domain